MVGEKKVWTALEWTPSATFDKPQDFPNSAEPPQPDGYSFSSSLINGRPGTHAYIRDMNRRVFSPYNVMTVGEVASKDAEELARYVNTDREEFDMAIRSSRRSSRLTRGRRKK